MSAAYNFKQIQKIPDANELIDITLSKTQRKTPTEIHANFKISRIRKFYMRKIKYMQEAVNEKLTGIVDGFPKLNDIHPFYADLMNILYDKDHYKLALGHVNKAKSIVDNVANDYVRLLKYADSLYRAKQLKRAALGRQCTLMKKLKSSLSYLEEVRKHLARLPQIDPNQRTLIVTGYPNVGKSSFMNNVTDANVDVQPYAFTTQSLYVGHTDYKYARWQVIDTPGILDHPLDERNTIEMQSITALAHLNACILYFIDISETCGYTIEQQISLFKNIKPLFQSKPLVIVLTKIDLVKYGELDKQTKDMIEKLAKEHNAYLIQMSNQSGDGISDVKQKACDILLDYRLTQKAKDPKKTEALMNRLHITQPKKRDNIDRPAIIPDTVKQGLKKTGPTIKDLQEEFGGAGNFYIPVEEHYQLEDEEWKFDRWPEFYLGKNVMDYYDPDIEEKLQKLEEEEDKLLKMESNENDLMEDEENSDGITYDDLKKALKEVRGKKAIFKLNHKLKKNLRARSKNKKLSDLEEHLEKKGIQVNKESLRQRVKQRKSIGDLEGNQDKLFNKALDSDGSEDDMMDVDDDKRVGRKRKRSMSMSDDYDEVDQVSGRGKSTKQSSGKKMRSLTPAQLKITASSKVRSMSKARREGSVPQPHPTRVVPEEQIRLAKKINKRFKHTLNINEADRHIPIKKPKHLYTGKRSNGKTDRR
ncbi:nucleolar gtp-binding protein 1 [Stylonychia lemnae]|uniref:Nucleolar GTP-binding protein 1 n=1 Tax=Stylonychia lemnae TaxID=5949 RepID=A0A078B3N5_STYLE|nr:nucleolar gtp-binding protein 1 [Stylonychia lemnae]|eukprot:CDW88118.1 nucleolar gtp-binding protein 1 [Stylonychia lemnae]